MVFSGVRAYFLLWPADPEEDAGSTGTIYERFLTRGVCACREIVCAFCAGLDRYEQGHGLVDAVQFQKKLKNDLHRLEAELEQRSLKARREDERDQPRVEK